MVFWRFVGIIISILLFIASIALGIFFFGILAVALAGLIGLFFVLWLLFYLNRKWRMIVAKVKENSHHKKSVKNKMKRHWEQHEEIIVKEVHEEKA